MKSLAGKISVIIVYAAVAAACLAPNAAGAQPMSVYSNQAQGFSLDYPSDWVIAEQGGGANFQLKLIDRQNALLGFSIMVLRSDSAEKTMAFVLNNPASLVEQNKQKWGEVARNMNGKLAFLGYDIVSVGSRGSLYCHARASGVSQGEAISLEFISYNTAYRDKAYLIMIGCDAADFGRLSGVFRTIMDSFRIF